MCSVLIEDFWNVSCLVRNVCLKFVNLCVVCFAGAQSWITKCWQRLLQYKIVSRVFKQQLAEQQQQSLPPHSSHEQANIETSIQQDTTEVGGAPT